MKKTPTNLWEFRLVEEEIWHLQTALDTINCKCWYYKQAMRDGDESRVHSAAS